MFNEQNSVENLIRDLLCGPQPANERGIAEGRLPYIPNGRNRKGAGWYSVPAHILPRHINEVFVEEYARQALIRLNSCIAEQPERAEEVLYRLRAIVLSARSDGLIHANEEFTAWLRGERSMPFGEHNQHVTIRLIDFDDLDQNQYIASTQFTYRAASAERRADLVLLVNGFPLVMVEAKTPVRHSVSWFDGAKQIHEDYERFVPELFVPNVFSAATEGKELRYGAVGTPLDQWGPWRPEEALNPGGLADLRKTVQSLFRPEVVLDILAHFTLFATDKRKRSSRWSAATSSTRGPTRSSSACWPARRARG